MKRSTGPDYTLVSPLGSVVIMGLRVLVLLRRREHMRGVPECFRRGCIVLRAQIGGPRMIRMDGTDQSPSKPCCKVSFDRWCRKSCGVRTPPAHASKW